LCSYLDSWVVYYFVQLGCSANNLHHSHKIYWV
jgi:hypothetical protein